MHSDACRATHVRGEQSQVLLERRMQCLDRHLEELRALSQLLTRADTAIARQALAAANDLSPLAGCADLQALRNPVPPPEGAKLQADVATLYQELAAIRASERVGQYAQVLARAQRASERAAELGYRPAMAESLFLLGELRQKVNNLAGAGQAFFAASVHGTAGRHHRLAALSFSMLTSNAALERQFDLASRYEQLAWAALDAAGGDADVRGRLLNAGGVVALLQKQYDKAQDRLQQALALRMQRVGADHPDVAAVLNNLSILQRRSGQREAALSMQQRVLAIYERRLGPWHPNVAASLRVCSVLLRDGERFAEASAALERALRIDEQALGREHPEFTRGLRSFGYLANEQNRHAQALSYFERSLHILRTAKERDEASERASLEAIADTQVLLARLGDAERTYREVLALAEKHHGLMTPRSAVAREGLASVLWHQGRLPEALRVVSELIGIQQKTVGEHSLDVARAWALQASILAEKKRRLAALKLHQQALSAREKQNDPAAIAESLIETARVLMSLRRASEAQPLIERVATLSISQNGQRRRVQAEAQFVHAQVLWSLDRKRHRAQVQALAAQARSVFHSQGTRCQRSLQKLDAWLRSQRLSPA
jgi:tetratricopeptide (TPR) repeat protein